MTGNSTGAPQSATDVANGSRLRMEKTREALDSLPTTYKGPKWEAALAEVEEWEARLNWKDEAEKAWACADEAKIRAEAAEAERDRLGDDVAEQALRIIDLERQSNELYTALEDLAQEAFSGDDRRAARRALEEARRTPTGDGSQ